MKLIAILAAASLTAAPSLQAPPAVSDEQVDMLRIPAGAHAEIDCHHPEGCIVVTNEFMRGYTRWVEEQTRKACRRTDI